MDVIPLHLADVTYPEWHPRTGIGPVFAFAVRSDDGIVLVDTGIGPPHELIDRLYTPRRRSLDDALAAHGIARAEVGAIVNTHLHFDHCGGNALFLEVPAYVQSDEYAAALEPGYTIGDWITFDGARFEIIDGESAIAPGVHLVPTPGHTPGHQSVLIDADDGAIVIAGQAIETAQEFRDAIQSDETDADIATNARRLLDLAPSRLYFSHDHEYWEPKAAL